MIKDGNISKSIISNYGTKKNIMKKGRGLVDNDIFNAMLKIPGTRPVLIGSLTNHIIDKKTGKVRAEIHEDSWQEVKNMVKQFKKL